MATPKHAYSRDDPGSILIQRFNLIALLIERFTNLECRKDGGNRDPYRITCHVSPGTNSSSEAECGVREGGSAGGTKEALRVEEVWFGICCLVMKNRPEEYNTFTGRMKENMRRTKCFQ